MTKIYRDTSIVPEGAAELSEGALAFVDKHKLAISELRDAIVLADCGLYAAYVCAGPREAQQTIANYFAWLIAFDDSVAENKDSRQLRWFAAEVSSFFEPRSMPTSYFGHALLACFPRRNAYFLRTVCDYVNGCLQESVFRNEGVVPSYESYFSFRHNTIGMKPVFAILAAYSSEPVSHAKTYELCLQASVCCAFANDYYSYRRGSDAGEDLFNLVSVLLARESEYSAIRRVASAYNYQTSILFSEADACGNSEYQKLVCRAVFGNTEWYANSPRYNDRGAV